MSEGEDRTVTDSTGRVLLVRDIGSVEQLDLYEMAGPTHSVNAAWLGTAMTTCSVRAIDQRAVPFPRTVDQFRALLDRLGRHGMSALRLDRQQREDAEEARLAASEGAIAKDDLAKN